MWEWEENNMEESTATHPDDEQPMDGTASLILPHVTVWCGAWRSCSDDKLITEQNQQNLQKPGPCPE